MFRFTRRSKLRKQLSETVAFIHKRIRIDRDIMTSKDIAFLHTEADRAMVDFPSKSADELQKLIESLNDAYQKIFPVKPNHWLRENGEVFLVAILVAMAFRAYFLQPFRIPTGSMQPTLYGITREPSPVAPPPGRAWQWVERILFGKKYVYLVNEERGSIKTTYVQWRGKLGLYPEIRPVGGPLFPASEFTLGGRTYTVPGTREQVMEMLNDRMKSKGEWSDDPVFERGEIVLNFQLISGDHLFVDRFSYNFVRPKRGDIFVFETKGIPVNASGQFYIKRCVALPGESIQIKNDDRVYIDGKPIPLEGAFKKIYSGKDGYQGHLNMRRFHQLAPDQPVSEDESHLRDADDSFRIPPKYYWAMGDNSTHSKDSRYFGPVPERNLVGRAFFVYWPFGKRWGVPE